MHFGPFPTQMGFELDSVTHQPCYLRKFTEHFHQQSVGSLFKGLRPVVVGEIE